MARYIELLSPERTDELNKRIYDLPVEKREAEWRAIDLPVEELENCLKDIIRERNDDAVREGFGSFADRQANVWQIAGDEYGLFMDRRKDVIDKINRDLESAAVPDGFFGIFSIPCFMCLLKEFPFTELSQVYEYIVTRYPGLRRYAGKIDIKDGEANRMRYEKEVDRYRVCINKRYNIRHQSLALVHELGHVVSFLEAYERGINPLSMGRYAIEKQAAENEINTMSSLGEGLFKAYLSEVLVYLWKTNFQLAMYEDPGKSLPEEYAFSFNGVYSPGRQKRNPLLFLEDEFAYKPLNSLVYAVAYCEYLRGEKLVAADSARQWPIFAYPCGHTIVGAEAFNDSVRNGKRWVHLA